MQLPGYTAKASLHSPDLSYVSKKGSNAIPGRLSIHPAQLRPPTGPIGGGIGFWTGLCEAGCHVAYAACCVACASPVVAATGAGAVLCLSLCNTAYAACIKACQ